MVWRKAWKTSGEQDAAELVGQTWGPARDMPLGIVAADSKFGSSSQF